MRAPPVTKGMLIARIDRDQVDQQRSRDEAGLDPRSRKSSRPRPKSSGRE